MAGNTGKMTRQALAERGPRMALLIVYKDDRLCGCVIASEQTKVFTATGRYNIYACAHSYSLSYLRRIAHGIVEPLGGRDR